MKKFLDLSSWSVAIGSMLIVAFAVVGCDDDDSWSPSARPNDEPRVESSSSGVTPQSSDGETSVSTGTMTDSRDGKTYRTVKIGDQVWMAENLNYAYTGIPYNYDGSTSDSTSWCYDNDPANCTKYGRLYTWAAAMDSVGKWSTNGKGCGYYKACSPTYPVRGVCPKGWHLPDSTEWNTLITTVGDKFTAGTALKSTSGWNDLGGESRNGTDAFGFSALPAGYRRSDEYFFNEGYNADFWSSTEFDGDCAYSMHLDYFSGAFLSASYNSCMDDGFSVRCLKD